MSEDKKTDQKVSAQSVEEPTLSALAVGLPTQPFSGVTTTLGFATGSTIPVSASGYTPVAWVEDDLSFPGFETADIEIKPLASKVVFRTPGRRDLGSCEGTASLVTGDTSFIAMQAAWFASSMMWWQVQLPDGTSATTGSTYTFRGYLRKFSPGPFTGDDKVMYSYEIAINGDVLFTAGS